MSFVKSNIYPQFAFMYRKFKELNLFILTSFSRLHLSYNKITTLLSRVSGLEPAPIPDGLKPITLHWHKQCAFHLRVVCRSVCHMFLHRLAYYRLIKRFLLHLLKFPLTANKRGKYHRLYCSTSFCFVWKRVNYTNPP